MIFPNLPLFRSKGFACLLLSIGMLSVITGSIVLCLFPTIIKVMMEKRLGVEEGRYLTYSKWLEIPIPIYFQVFFFNLTNPLQFSRGQRPKLKEIGPYTYKERRVKEVVGWDKEKGTVQYYEVKYYHFDRSLSVGSEHDPITTVNTPLVGISKFIDDYFPSMLRPFVYPVVNTYTLAQGERSFMTKSVKQLLFEGYKVKLAVDFIDLVRPFMRNLPNVIPNNTFAYLYGMNATRDMGMLSVYTGVKDIDNYTLVESYKNKTTLDMWGDEQCDKIEGTDGFQYIPNIKSRPKLKLFIPELCRTVEIEYFNETKVLGVPTKRYAPTKDLFSYEGRNKCFCLDPKRCPKYGTYDISKCRAGAPVSISLPHFYLAHPSYLEAVDGLDPNEERHQSFADVEPLTGQPLGGTRRFQVNVDVRLNKAITALSNVSSVYFPAFWVSEGARASPELIGEFNRLATIPLKAGYISLILMIVLGALWILSGTILRLYFRCKLRQREGLDNATFNIVYTPISTKIPHGSPEEKLLPEDISFSLF